MIWLLTLLLFVAAPAWAQDEDLAPNGENNPSDVYDNGGTNACNTVACDDEIDEDPDSAVDDLEVCFHTNTSATIRFDFPVPANAPDTGTNAQTVHLIMDRSEDGDAGGDSGTSCVEDTGGNDPSFSLELYCNDTATGTLVWSGQNITATDQSWSSTFTYPGACATDGSDLQFHVTLIRSGGSPSARRWAAIEAMEWEVTWAATGRTRRMLHAD